MIKIALYHFIFETCIEVLFGGIVKSFIPPTINFKVGEVVQVMFEINGTPASMDAIVLNIHKNSVYIRIKDFTPSIELRIEKELCYING